jgi:hypothetical protein
MSKKIRYLSVATREALWNDVDANIERYRSGDFSDLSVQYGWNSVLSEEMDPAPFSLLVGEKGVDAEVNNALLVWKALGHVPASLATEDRIWTRLCHVEGLAYSKARWLDLSKADEELAKQVRDHFFGKTLTRYRDDNAISRLWWNAYIAWLAMPDNHELALKTICEKADIRSNLVERTQIFSRPEICASFLRHIIANDWVREKEENWRAYFRSVNKFGGGMLFEVMNSKDVNGFMDYCLRQAKLSLTRSQ